LLIDNQQPLYFPHDKNNHGNKRDDRSSFGQCIQSNRCDEGQSDGRKHQVSGDIHWNDQGHQKDSQYRHKKITDQQQTELSIVAILQDHHCGPHNG
jgi:hypothetical protein